MNCQFTCLNTVRIRPEMSKLPNIFRLDQSKNGILNKLSDFRTDDVKYNRDIAN